MKVKRKRLYIVLMVILIVIIAARIALPYVAKNYINKQLNSIDGYHASIEDLGMRLYRGAFHIGNLYIYEEASSEPDIPFVKIPVLDFNIGWRALFKGKLVAEIYLDALEVNFTKYKEEISADEDPRVSFAQELQELNPIEINKFEIKNAKIAYRDPTSSPEVNVYFDHFNLYAHNLSNVENPEVALPASIRVESKAMGDGDMVVLADLNILKEIPDFDLSISFENIDLVRFNNFMEAYANLNLKGGILNVYSETIAKNGNVTGYVKPVIEEFEVNTEEDERSLFEQVYETTIDIAAGILENRQKERIASRVEIAGNIENVETSIFQTIFSLLRNAFIEAYSKEIENVINFGSIDSTSDKK